MKELGIKRKLKAENIDYQLKMLDAIEDTLSSRPFTNKEL